MLNQEFDGVDRFLGTFHQGVQTVDIDTTLFSRLARVLVSAASGMTGKAAGGTVVRTAVVMMAMVAAGVRRGVRVLFMGLTVMKGAKYMVRGDCPSSVVPSKGLEAGHVRMYALANASRFCKVLIDGRRLRMRVFSWSSCHTEQMTQGCDGELGGSNVKPRSLRGYARWVTIWHACAQPLTGRLGSLWSACKYICIKRGDCHCSITKLTRMDRTALHCRCPWFTAMIQQCPA